MTPSISTAPKQALIDGLVLATVAVLLRGPTLGLSEISWDETIFALVGAEIVRGHWPFTTIFDHKPVGLYLHFAAAVALFGDNPTAGRLLGLLVVTGSAFIVRQVTVHVLARPRTWGLLFGISFLFASHGLGGAAAVSEHFVNLYLLLTAYLLLRSGRRRDAVLSGISAGAAIWVNYLALLPLAGLVTGYVVGASSAASDRRWNGVGRLTPWVLGAAVASAGFLAPLVLLSDPQAYFGPQLSFLAAYADADTSDALVELTKLVSPFFPLVAAALALAYTNTSAGQDDQRQAADKKRLTATASTGAAVGAAIAAGASGYLFDHYALLLLVPVWLLLAAFAPSSSDRVGQAVFGAVVAGTALMMSVSGLYYTAVGTYDLTLKARGGSLRMDQPREIARRVAPQLRDGGQIYSVCAPVVLYQLLHTPPPTRYPFYPHHLNPQYARSLGFNVDEEVAAIFMKEPAVVVLGDHEGCWGVPRSSWLMVARLLARDGYRATGRVGPNTIFFRTGES